LTLLALAVPARWLERWRRRLRVASVAFIVVYLSAAISLRTMALGRFERLLDDSMRPAAAGAPTPAESAGELTGAPTVLPQPLAFTRWVGLARTDSGLVRSFVNALEGETALETFVNANDRFVDSAMTTSHVRDYLRFARFPYVMSGPVSGGRLVEFRDYQFSVDPWIIRAFGAAERDVPFVMQMRYDSTARLVSVLFNNKPVPLER
jgi:hypothetical protein